MKHHTGKKSFFRLSALIWVLAVACMGQEEQQASLYTQVPDDWRAEVIPFPLPFAPEIPYGGREELRFAPGMFTAGAEDYFTYSFLWWLQGKPTIDHQNLQQHLSAYFRGLYQAVSKKESKDTTTFQVRVTATREPAWVPGAEQNFRITVRWIDPFVTEKELDLNLMAAQWFCPDQNHTAVYFMVSPQNSGHPLWQTMKAMNAGRCL